MSDVQIAVIDQQDTQIVLAVPGVQGATGSSIPSGGTTDQVLRKNSSTNYDAGWTQVTSAMIADGAIVNADVNNGAAIAGTKISPDFGGQAVTTTGQVNAARVNVTANTAPTNGIYLPSANNVAISTGGSGRLFVDASGRVGIGTSEPSNTLHVAGTSLIADANNGINLTLTKTGGFGSALQLQNTSGDSNDLIRILDSSNNIISQIQPATNGINFAAGRVGIGTASASYALDVSGQIRAAANATLAQLRLERTGSSTGHSWLGAQSDALLAVLDSSFAEKMRLDSSGRLLVGTSSTSSNATALLQGYGGAPTGGAHLRLAAGTSSPASGANLGLVLFSDSEHTNCALISADRDGGTWSGASKPTRLVFSTTADGVDSPTPRITIANNGIFTIKTSANDIAVGGTLGTAIAAATRAGIHFGAPASLIPTDGNAALTDNACSLGISAYRWSTVYAGTGTINTSDSTLKQDIAGLGQAELNVAATIKTRIKKFRFVDAVASKGDDARIHVGVIAQEVEQAFVDEGLDPRRYAMFCEDTLDDGSKRLGIRYDELLAFVIAAL